MFLLFPTKEGGKVPMLPLRKIPEATAASAPWRRSTSVTLPWCSRPPLWPECSPVPQGLVRPPRAGVSA